MLSTGKAVKVSIYLSEGSTYHGASRYSSILDFLFFRGVSGATVLKGVAGFGADHHLHSASSVEISDRLPLKIEFIESREKVDELLGTLQEMCGSGMIEIQETTVAKPAQASKAKEIPGAVHVKIEGKAKLMRIFIGESDRWQDKPLHEALVLAMRAHDLQCFPECSLQLRKPFHNRFGKPSRRSIISPPASTPSTSAKCRAKMCFALWPGCSNPEPMSAFTRWDAISAIPIWSNWSKMHGDFSATRCRCW